VAVGNLLCRQVGASRTLAGIFRKHGRSSQRGEKGARELPSQTGGLDRHPARLAWAALGSATDAKTIDLSIPLAILARADEVID
jgi:hypothetical protein